MTTDEIFEAFGGIAALMALTGARRNAINNWRWDGIPYRYFRVLLREAERAGIRGISLETLEASRPIKTTEAA
jgi:hypothetical protein